MLIANGSFTTIIIYHYYHFQNITQLLRKQTYVRQFTTWPLDKNKASSILRGWLTNIPNSKHGAHLQWEYNI